MDKGKTEEKIVREFSAGGVVYKLQDKKVSFLVTRSNPSKLYPHDVWRLPKGWIDDEGDGPGPIAKGKIKATEHDLENAALREVIEEGGVEAKIISKIGTEKMFFKAEGKNILKFVTYYVLEWKSNIPQGFGPETSEVLWLDYTDARKILCYSLEKKVIDNALKFLQAKGNI